ncbi:WG repeat-containing protein [Thalassospira sp. TSL5-1]|uniref:WG repeat-containing protein n=1 Tax=Thalassospira sp. TSL5-1 TaxID=1544451 RepID=UPI00093AEA60|nr:WG repeat-containing protein [Thalassospira sp. TSL5-1]OKH89114.1 hypothetical protein LF95_03420 [Thalassospira sp. TSL5-1]
MKHNVRAGIIGVALFACLFLVFIVFRGIAPGYYFEKDFDPDGEKQGWIEAYSFLPILASHWENGGGPVYYLDVPFVHYLYPFSALLPGARYTVQDDAFVFSPYRQTKKRIRFSSLSRDEEPDMYAQKTYVFSGDPGFYEPLVAKWRAKQQGAGQDFAELEAVKPMTGGWTRNVFYNRFSLNVPMTYFSSEYLLRAVSKEDRPSGRIRFSEIRLSGEEEIYAEFYDDYKNYRDVGGGILVGSKPDGGFKIIKTLKDNRGRYYISGDAVDLAEARDFVAIIKSTTPDYEASDISVEDYFTSPLPDMFADAQSRFDQMLRERVEHVLQPGVFMAKGGDAWRFDLGGKNAPELQGYVEILDEKRLKEAQVRLDQAWREYKDVTVSRDRGRFQIIEFSIGSDDRFEGNCVVNYLLKAQKPYQGEDVYLNISGGSESASFCMAIATLLDQADISSVQNVFDTFVDQQGWYPLRAYYETEANAQGTWILKARKQIRVVSKTGEELLSLDQSGGIFFDDNGRIIVFERDGDGDKAGMYDANMNQLIPPVYDEVVPWYNGRDLKHRDFARIKQDGRVGLFDLDAGKVFIEPGYDEIFYWEDWAYYRAQRGNNSTFFDEEGAEVIPGGGTDYVAAQMMRGGKYDNDFIAVKRVSDGNWVFLTRVKQPLLEGTFKKVKLVYNMGDQIYELIRTNGEKLYVKVSGRDDGLHQFSLKDADPCLRDRILKVRNAGCGW